MFSSSFTMSEQQHRQWTRRHTDGDDLSVDPFLVAAGDSDTSDDDGRLSGRTRSNAAGQRGQNGFPDNRSGKGAP